MKKLCTTFVLINFWVIAFQLIPANDLSASGIDPTFNLTAKNITHYPQANGQDSILTFELYLQQTNQGQPGVNEFEYCAGQFTFRYNTAIHSPGGNLRLGIVAAGSALPPALRPPSFQVDSVSGFLKASGNLPNSLENFFISGTYPGTRILTFRVITNKKQFNPAPLNLQFKLGPSPNTFLAYFLPYPDTVDSEQFPAQFAVALMDTLINNYSVEDTSSGTIGDIVLIFPSYNSLTLKKHIDFVWHQRDSVESYKLEISDDVVFNNIVYADSAITDTMKTVSSLIPNKLYYWRVWGKKNSNYTSVSATWLFNTGSIQTSLNFPGNNYLYAAPPVTFSWFNTGIVTLLKPLILQSKAYENIIFSEFSNTGKISNTEDPADFNIEHINHDFPADTKYTLEVANDQNFTSIVYRDSLITDTFKTVANLNHGSEYYWRVIPENDSIFVTASETRQFSTYSGPVTLVYPPNNSINIPVSLNFSWNEVSSALNYRFELSADSLFNNLIINDTAVADTFRNVSGLSPNSFYFWRVKSNNSIGSNISPAWKFTTIRSDSLPTFNMTVKNIMKRPNISYGQDSILSFEVWMQQTNQGQPGIHDLEYAAAQFTFRYNKTIQRPGENLAFGIIPSESELPPSLRPQSYQVDSLEGYLKASSNLPQSLANFFISGTFPGTKILTFRLVTSRQTFSPAPLNLSFKLGASPNTFAAYFVPYPPGTDTTQTPSQVAIALLDTVVNHYSVEDSGSVPEGDIVLAFPEYNSLTVKKHVDFVWYPRDSVESYKLEISNDNSFNNIVFADSAITDTVKTVSTLSANEVYYWRVTGKKNSAYFTTSATWVFNTASIQPLLAYPGANYLYAAPPVTFTWLNTGNVPSLKPIAVERGEYNNLLFSGFDNAGTAHISNGEIEYSSHDFPAGTLYTLEVANDQNFTSIVFRDSLVTDTFKTVASLNHGREYYWRVIPENDSIFVSASEIRSFGTYSGVVNLVYPSNNSVDIPSSLTFLWNKVSTALNYHFMLSTDSLFNNVIINDSTITDTLRYVSDLNPNEFYFWRVKSNNSGGNNISPTWKFNTIRSDSMPTFDMTVRNITTRPNFSQGQDSILTFELWLQQTNQGQPGIHDLEYAAAQYTFAYNRIMQRPGENFVFGIIPSESGLPPALRPPSFQVDSALGYLKASGNLPQSQANFFISGTFPGTKILTFKLVTSMRSFAFYPLGLRFKLGASPNTFPAYFAPYPPDVDSTLFPSQVAIALLDTVINHYTVEFGGFLLPVELTSFSSATDRDKVSLHWTTSHESNNSGFEIERSSVIGEWIRAGAVAGSGNSNDVRNYSFSEKLNTGKYKYRLKQIDYNGNLQYFNLENEVEVGVPDKFSLSQNYPNPFNPATKIDYELPFDANVSLVIYDISGKEIAVLVNENKQAGYYTTDFNASNLSSGIYVYMIKAGNFKMTKKMAVVK